MASSGATMMVLAAFVSVGSAGCSHRATSAAKPTTEPSNSPIAVTTTVPGSKSFDDPTTKLHIDFPDGWQSVDSKDDVVLLKRPDAKSSHAPTLTVDIPVLPAHIPNLIPLGMTVDGYLDDLKKNFGTVDAKKEAGPKIEGTKTERVTSTFTMDGVKTTELAVIVIRRDNIYLFLSRFPTDSAAQTPADFEKLVQSIGWR